MKTSLHHQEIAEILKKGKRVVAEGIVVVHKGKKGGVKRYAIIISKKKIKKNSDRNKVRRIIREVLREIDPQYSPMVILCTKTHYNYKTVKDALSVIKL